MNRLDWTDWARFEADQMENQRLAGSWFRAYGEWLEERLQVLPEQDINALAEEFRL